MSASSDFDIAVIGVSCEFGSHAGLDEYWRMLRGRQSCIRALSVDEMEDRGALHQYGADDVVLSISPLKDIALFDNRKFGISNRDANIVDPQLRLMLRHASQALRTSGYDPALYWGRIGVYGSASISMEWAWEVRDSLGPGRSMAISEVPYVERDFYITRLAYHLGLRGPAVLVNSACSSSHVAIHTAIQALLAGDCDIALAGAASVRPFWAGYQYQEGGFFSPSGRCAPFSDQADGTVPGEGAAFVALKRLEAAREDGDKVFCVIKASAINNDGNQKPGYAGPSERGQAEVIAAALAGANIDPAQLAYVETHGTGTKLGDPIEISALGKALKRWGKADRVHIGSVKANIGHTDVVAGLAGLIKSALILRHGVIPPELPVPALNGLCKFDETPFDLAQQEAALPDRPDLCAGISSFGIGGTNGHIIIAAGDDDFSLAAPPPEAGTRFDGMLRKRNARRDARRAGAPAEHDGQAGAGEREPSEQDAAAILAILREHAPATEITPQSRLQDLGIDSIGVIMITEELDSQFGHTLSAARFAELSTVADLVRAMRAADGAAPPAPGAAAAAANAAADEADVPDHSPLTLGQNRFFYPQVAAPAAEMGAAIFELSGDIQAGRVKTAVARTILHHQALRSRYLRDTSGHWYAHYDDFPANGYFRYLRPGPFAAAEVDAHCRRVFADIDFGQAPLFFAHLLQFDDGKYLLLLFSHKVMLDGNSFRLLAQDFAAYYRSEQPPPATPVALYARQQNAWFDTIDPLLERDYWARPEWRRCGALPVDQEAGIGGKVGDETELRDYLDVEQSAALLARMKPHKVAMMDLILYAVASFATAESDSAWTQMSCTFGGRSDLIGASGHDFSRTVGLLALNGLLLLHAPAGATPLERIDDVRRQLAAIPGKGLSYFIGSAAPLKPGVERINVDHQPLYNRQLSVNFHGYEGYDAPHISSAEVRPVGSHVHVPPEYDRWCRLDFNFGFEDGRFFISCKYSARQYRAETMARHVAAIRAMILSVPA